MKNIIIQATAQTMVVVGTTMIATTTAYYVLQLLNKTRPTNTKNQ